MCSRYNLTNILANRYRYLAVVLLLIPIATCSPDEASSLPWDSVVPPLGSPRGNGRLNMVSICGTTLSLACSSADAHHTQSLVTSCTEEQLSLACSSADAHHNQSPIISCAEMHRLNHSFFSSTDAHYILSPITSCAERNNSISRMFFCRCSPYSISHYILSRRAIKDYTK
jgi:hypothetical protein